MSFDGSIDRTSSESTQAWPPSPVARDGAPDVVVILLDDVGFAQFGCYGSDIATPNIDRLAAEGLRYNSFQATPMCAPTRAALMTGRQSHAVGVGVVQESAMGFPGYHGRLSHRATTVAEALAPAGYASFAVGKWHLAPISQWRADGPFDSFPLQRGFERFYGFLEGGTDQWHPELVEGNRRIEPPDRPGYHLTEDLVDTAISYIRDLASADPDKPFFLYLALGACHSPHHVPSEYVERYRGRYDRGWDVTRAEWFARQIELGIVPPDTRLAPRNPGVEPWDDLSAEQQRLYARYQEVFAGFMEHTDQHIGRLMQELETLGRSDNTLVVLLSDNGAADNGGPHGWADWAGTDKSPEDRLSEGLAAIDRLGDETTRPMYPFGWAQVGNTPFRHYKIDTYAGGTAVPLIVRWPARIRDGGMIRPQYHHVSDIYPTILDAVGVEAPQTYHGLDQMPVHGTSMSYTFADDDAAIPTHKRLQYFENFGHRALWRDGWKAVTKHRAGDDYSTEHWALYDLASDFSEYEDLAAQHPERVRELIELWWAEAGRYNVLPLDDQPGKRPREIPPQARYVYYPGAGPISSRRAPAVQDRSHTITADVVVPGNGCQGVLFAVGSAFGGYTLYVVDGHVVYEYNLFGQRFRLRSDRVLTPGRHIIRFAFSRTARLRGVGTLDIDGEANGRIELPETIPDLVPPGPVRCGRDGETPVSDAYTSPFAFTGTLSSVTVDVDLG